MSWWSLWDELQENDSAWGAVDSSVAEDDVVQASQGFWGSAAGSAASILADAGDNVWEDAFAAGVSGATAGATSGMQPSTKTPASKAPPSQPPVYSALVPKKKRSLWPWVIGAGLVGGFLYLRRRR